MVLTKLQMIGIGGKCGVAFSGGFSSTLNPVNMPQPRKTPSLMGEKCISRGSEAGLAIIQAALIGHTYAMLSGVGSNRLPARMYISNRNHCQDT